MKFKVIFSFLGFLLILFIGIPIVKMMISTDPLTLVSTSKEPEVYSSIFLTFRASVWATIIALITGVPLAYLLARREFVGKKIIEGLIDLPVIIPHTAAGIALLTVWGRNSLFSKATGINVKQQLLLVLLHARLFLQ
jgi:molybdate/tungstate transport system permease protein